MVNKIIKYFILKLENWCEHSKRSYLIQGREANGDALEDTYLVRHILFKTTWFSLYIHRFLRSDSDIHHDHPWSFLTYIVDGQYDEERLYPINDYYKCEGQLFFSERKTRKQGTIAYRSSGDVHRVIIDKNYTFEERKTAPLTFCIIGPRQKQWGFWKPMQYNSQRRVWVQWDIFLKDLDRVNKIKRSDKAIEELNDRGYMRERRKVNKKIVNVLVGLGKTND